MSLPLSLAHWPRPPADILLGYHSEEGWTAFLRIFSGHYGLEAEVGGSPCSL